ncbi:MAG TPA: ribosome biogenesis GTPase Der [Terriglobia bacterium]|nr:ribosome biogenesis GTPase Der [Terriglobia bacterium]
MAFRPNAATVVIEQPMPQLPLIVILGRPNVGKSTLFNRIVGSRRALVGNEPGMTRDRIEGTAEWAGARFKLVDTGGIVPQDRDLMATEIFRHARMAIDRAAHLILVVDGRDGVLPLDQELSNLLRKTGKPFSVAVNKIDLPMHDPLAAEFARLGVEHTFAVSAEHGLGVDQLLNHVTAGFEAPEEVPASPEAPVRIAIIGRPNVGKSTLLNRLAGEERSIVTPIPGTTRDAVDAEVERDGAKYVFIDTAGIRRKGKTKLLAEKLSVIQARKHLEQADIALFIVDAEEGVTALDTHIAGYAHESRRSVILVVNKWDAIQKGPTVTRDYTQELRQRMKFLDYAPIAFISALRGQRLPSLWSLIAEVASARKVRVPTARINVFLKGLDLRRLPSQRGRPLRIYYLTQAAVSPPTFVAFTNRTGKLHFSVERYLENRIREEFGFMGSPIVIRSRPHK